MPYCWAICNEPSVRLLMVVYHAARKLAHLLVLRLVGRQLPEPDLGTVRLCRVQQEDLILDMQLARIGKSGAGRQPQGGERGGQAEYDPAHAAMAQQPGCEPEITTSIPWRERHLPSKLTARRNSP
jgi:hypothetical protein